MRQGGTLSIELKKDLVWTFSSQILIMFVVLAVNKVVSAHLGVEGFALYSIAKKSSTVLKAIVLWGTAIALPRFLAMDRISKNERLFTWLPSALLILLAVFAILFLGALLFPSLMGEWILGGLGNKTLLIIIILYSSAFAFNDLVVGYLRGRGNFKKSNIVQIFTQFSLLVGVVLYQDISSIFFSWAALIFVICSIFVARGLSKDIKNSLLVRGWAPLVSSGKRLLSYGTPRMLADLVFQLTSFVPLLVVFSKFGKTATGLFSTAITLQLMIIPLFSFSGQILLQRVSEMIARADFTKIRRIIRLFMFIFTSVAAVGVVTIGVGIDFWLSLLFSKKFLPAASLVIIVAPSLIPRAIYLLLRNPLDAVSNIPYNLFSLLIWFAIYIVSLFVADSIEACAWGYTLSSVTLAVTSLLFWHKALNKTIEKQKERLQD